MVRTLSENFIPGRRTSGYLNVKEPADVIHPGFRASVPIWEFVLAELEVRRLFVLVVHALELRPVTMIQRLGQQSWRHERLDEGIIEVLLVKQPVQPSFLRGGKATPDNKVVVLPASFVLFLQLIKGVVAKAQEEGLAILFPRMWRVEVPRVETEIRLVFFGAGRGVAIVA